jgi:hypothetical protein
MQVLDDTGKVLMNIVGGERIFQLSTLRISGSFKKKVDRGEANEEEQAHESDYTQNTQNQNTFKSRLNGQPQLTIIQVAKS